jgi:hypothetical protein
VKETVKGLCGALERYRVIGEPNFGLGMFSPNPKNLHLVSFENENLEFKLLKYFSFHLSSIISHLPNLDLPLWRPPK